VARPPRYKHYVDAAKDEALLACELYNERRRPRNLEAFFIHICIAWVNLLQAVFERDDIDYFYRLPNGNFVRIDGEKKSWDLSQSLKQYFKDPKDPVLQNILFFVGLRNKVEHRLNEKEHAALAEMVAGKTQALVRNFEATLVKEFSPKESLADQLHLPIFLSSLSDGALEAIKNIKKAVPKGVVSYIDKFDASVGEDIANSNAYDFRIRLIPKTGNKTNADAAIEFVNVDALDDEAREKLEQTMVIIREKQVQVSNAGLLKPGDVVKRVKNVFAGFTYADHVVAWNFFKVRPPGTATNKENTDARYCVYDGPHKDYVYSEAWVKKIIAELGDDPRASLNAWKHEIKTREDVEAVRVPAPVENRLERT
jgi:hypothetical protein